MERIDSILSLVSRTGAKLGVLKHTSRPKTFNSIVHGGHHHPSSRDIKDKDRILWVLMDEERREEENSEGGHVFPWEEDKDHRDSESDQEHNLNINLKVHGDLNDQLEHTDRNKFLSADWTTGGHSTYWKLSMLWDGNSKGEGN